MGKLSGSRNGSDQGRKEGGGDRRGGIISRSAMVAAMPSTSQEVIADANNKGPMNLMEVVTVE